MNDPASIACWFKVNPQRHALILRHWLRSDMFSQFWPAIAAARELVK